MRFRILPAAILAACLSSTAHAAEAVLVVQRSPLAGFRHYEGQEAWPALRVGDRLELTREPENPYDANAVRVRWRGRMLGYVPRRDNAAVARLMDRGTVLEARIASLTEHRNRSMRLEFEVVAPLTLRGNGNRKWEMETHR